MASDVRRLAIAICADGRVLELFVQTTRESARCHECYQPIAGPTTNRFYVLLDGEQDGSNYIAASSAREAVAALNPGPWQASVG